MEPATKRLRRSTRAGRGNSGGIWTVYGSPDTDWKDVMDNWMAQGQAVLIKGAVPLPVPGPTPVPVPVNGSKKQRGSAGGSSADDSPKASAETWWRRPAESLAAVMAADGQMVADTWCKK